jgi:hypothetical protein
MLATRNEPVQCAEHTDTAFEWEVPEQFNFAVDVVDALAAAQPDKMALLWTNEKGDIQQFTFADMTRLSSSPGRSRGP